MLPIAELRKMTEDELTKAGYARVGEHGFAVIGKNSQLTKPPAANGKQGCGSCRGRLNGLPDPARVGQKSFGAASFVRAKISGKIEQRWQDLRLATCRACQERDDSGARLFREVDGKPHCGAPHGLIERRDEYKDGCGCELTDKVRWNEAACPRALWGPGANFGRAVTIEPARKIPNVIDIHVRSKAWPKLCNGIGDALVMATVAAGYQKQRPDKIVRLIVNPAQAQWAALFYPHLGIEADGTVGEEEFWPFDTGARDDKARETGVNRHQAWAAGVGTTPERLAPHIKDEDAAWGRAEIEQYANGKRAILLSPLSAWPQRTWPPHHWVDLIQMLSDAGYWVGVIERQKETARVFPCRYWYGFPPSKVAALIQAADLFIGNDSGMTHLAGCLGKRAIAICGPTHGETVFGFYPSVEPISSYSKCAGCLWQKENGWRAACHMQCEALWNVTAADVMALVKHMLPYTG